MTIKLDNIAFQAALRESQRRKGQRAGTSERDASLSTLKVWYSGLDKTGFYPHHAYRGPEESSEVESESAGSDNYTGSINENKSYETKPSMVFFERLESVLPEDVDASLWSAISGVMDL